MLFHTRGHQKKTGEPYPGATLYQMIVAIQKHLRINGIRWNLVYGAEFIQVRTVLDNVMKEHTEANVGTGKKRAKLVTYDVENDLWNRNFLGVDTPDKLRTTAYFCIGMGFFCMQFRSIILLEEICQTRSLKLLSRGIVGD